MLHPDDGNAVSTRDGAEAARRTQAVGAPATEARFSHQRATDRTSVLHVRVSKDKMAQNRWAGLCFPLGGTGCRRAFLPDPRAKSPEGLVTRSHLAKKLSSQSASPPFSE